MAGIYDDLIPNSSTVTAPPPSSSGGLYDDLIPTRSNTDHVASSIASGQASLHDVAPISKDNMFSDLIGGFGKTLSNIGGATVKGFESEYTPAPVNGNADFLKTPAAGKTGIPDIGGGWDTLTSAFHDAVDRGSNAILSLQDSHQSALQKGTAIGEAGIGALNALFSPVSAALKAASPIPGVGHAADAINALFGALSGAGGTTLAGGLDGLPIPQDTKDTLRPLVTEVGSLAAQLIAGKAGADAIPKLTAGTKKIAQVITDNVQKAPQPSGFINPYAAGKDIQETITNAKDYVQKANETTQYSQNLSGDLNKLVQARKADDIRGQQLLKQADLSPKDAEAIYNYAEDKSVTLTPDQMKAYTDFIKPLQDARAKIYEKIKNEGIPLQNDNYTPRYVADKGGFFERLQRGAKGAAGGILSKSSPQFKHRVMRIAVDEEGNRHVVSVKDKEVTAYNKGKASSLGSIPDYSDRPFREFYDSNTMRRLNEVAKKLGVKHERVKGGRGFGGGNRAGVSFQGEDLIKTRLATPDSVLAHELGHQIDHKYALQSKFIKGGEMQNELRKLSDLRLAEDSRGIPSGDRSHFEKYIRKGSEKMAVMFEAYLRNRELFKSTAPHVYEKFVDFLGSHEELKPLLDIQPSLELGMAKVGGNTLEHGTFKGKDGKTYTLGDATTKEIEGNTDLKYHKNVLLNELVSFNKLKQVDRAIQFLESFKADPEFSKIGIKETEKDIPSNWKRTHMLQFRGYYFDPKVADVLNHFAGRISAGEDAGKVLESANSFLRNSIFFNPFIHVPNITVHWLVNRGALNWLNPVGYARLLRTGGRAIRAVLSLNQDYLQMLDRGVNLQYADSVGNLQDLMLKKIGEELQQPEHAQMVTEMAKSFAMSPAKLVKTIYKFSGKVTWSINDIATMQAIYEEMDRGIPMNKAIEDTAKHIPNYQVPARVLNSRALSKIMTNPGFTMFGAYHYGLWRSYGELVKSVAGKVPFKERADAVDKLVMLGFVTLVIYPQLDQLAKELTGNQAARFRRAGAATGIYNTTQLISGKMSFAHFLQSVFTPAPLSKVGVDLITGKDIYSGRDLSQESPGQYVANQISPVQQASQIIQGKKTPGQFVGSLIGISSTANTPSVQNLNNLIYNQRNSVSAKVKDLYNAGNKEEADNLIVKFDTELLNNAVDAYREAGIQVTDEPALRQWLMNNGMKSYLIKIPTDKQLQNRTASKSQTGINKIIK